ncbi:MAG: hypothetical protein NC898_05830 [Candidatus Omnitrophica bacterium]|nr:hypothetical protein [Candidatus Omnitrophota bacterium]MCM8793962.1 hypothetical protein [Candidatus Omnitrophota bacterium]
MKTRINLLPKELIKKEKRKGLEISQLRVILVIFLPLIVWKLLVAGIQFKINSALNRKTKEITELSQKIVNLRTSAETELKAKQDKLSLLKEQITLKEGELKNFKPVAELIATRKEKFVYALLKTTAEKISGEVWLEEMGFEREEKIFYLKGIGLSHSKIALFLSRLNQFPYIKGLYLKQSEIKTEEGNKQPLIFFTAEGKLNL